MRTQLQLWLATISFVAALFGCGPGVVSLEEPDVEIALDDGTGDVLADPDPVSIACPQEPCDDLPPDDDAGLGDPAPDAGADFDAGLPRPDAGTFDAGTLTPDAGHLDGGPLDAGPNLWAPNASVLVRGYVSIRTAAMSDAGMLTSVQPAGGVTDSAHGGGMTRGLVPPGQVVTLITGTRTNGFYQVRYAGQSGWVSASWLAPMTTPSRAAFALQPTVRNAFFKHQLHRTRWNKDGPFSSGTCAPTSLAMAVHALGKEPAALSVEESIHRVRLTYGATSDSTGTFRAQITTAARALGMSVSVLETRLTATAMLTRIDGQLAAARMVVLEGQPAAAYQAAFNRAYQAESLTNRYTFAGRHSIVVLGREGSGYVVGDPLSEVGMVTLTGAQLMNFFATWGGTGNAVWASP